MITAVLIVPVLGQTSASSLVTKSHTLLQQEKYEDALVACNNAIDLDPYNSMAWNNKAYALLELKRTEEALQAAEKAINIDRRWGSPWVNKACALLRLNRTEQRKH